MFFYFFTTPPRRSRPHVRYPDKSFGTRRLCLRKIQLNRTVLDHLFWGIRRDRRVLSVQTAITFIAARYAYFYINALVIKIMTIKYGPIGFYRFCAIYTVLSERWRFTIKIIVEPGADPRRLRCSGPFYPHDSGFIWSRTYTGGREGSENRKNFWDMSNIRK